MHVKQHRGYKLVISTSDSIYQDVHIEQNCRLGEEVFRMNYNRKLLRMFSQMRSSLGRRHSLGVGNRIQLSLLKRRLENSLTCWLLSPIKSLCLLAVFPR